MKFSIKEVVENSLIDTRNELTAAQRNQMLHGERSSGKKIGKYKNPDYAVKKYQMNPLAGLGFKDLKLEGDFHKEIIVDVRQNAVVFGSADEKTSDIIEREGDNIFGLTKERAAEHGANYLAEAANNRIKKIINGE